MNNINLCYYKKFTANYGDSFYICKKCQCLNCNNSCNICPYIRYVKIACLLSLFQKKNRTENVKMLLQSNYINNGVTNGVKQKKEKSI